MNNTNYFWGSKKTVAQSVKDWLKTLSPGSAWTTITAQWPLGGYSVVTVIDESLEDIEHLKVRNSCYRPSIILKGHIPAG